MNALIDTGLLLDYLNGDRRAAVALDGCAHRSISVVTWLEVMSLCPAPLQEATRGFLRSFERLSISESIADEALKLLREHPGLDRQRALTWATATINQLVLVTSEPGLGPDLAAPAARSLVVPYEAKSKSKSKPGRVRAASGRGGQPAV